MSGYGRGGRGAAILQALENPARKPGENGDGEPRQQPQANPPKLGLGRGALMAHLLQQTKAANAPADQTPGTAEPKAIPIGRGFGRGLFAQAQNTSEPVPCAVTTNSEPPKPMGRASLLASAPTFGRGMMKTAPSPAPVSPVGIRPSPPSEPAAPLPQATATKLPSDSGGDAPRRSMIDRMMRDMSLESHKEMQRGTSGSKTTIGANYIRLNTANNDGVYLYHVDFSPPLDSLGIRKRLLRDVESVPQPFEFDGANMFMPVRIPGDKLSVKASTREGKEYQINISWTRVIPYAHMTQFFNVVFHRIMMELKMAPVRRMYYDSHAPIYIPQHKLEVWPGYVSSVKEYDGGLMCLLDTTHKVLRQDTVYSVMSDIERRQRGDFRDAVTKAIVGSIVLTRYNNKTYRIDDIDWDQNPTSTFETQNGPLSYQQYYADHHNKKGLDTDQPLLIHRPSKREQRESRGRPLEVICLVPELCYLTGLTDECRADFKVMKDLAAHTRISPGHRQERLRQFCENVNSHSASRKILSDWGLSLENDGITLAGRLLEPEKILLGQNRQVSAGPKAEWTSAFSRNPVREAIDLNQWMVLCTRNNQMEVQAFIGILMSVYPQMGCRISNPRLICLPNDRTESYLQEIGNNLTDQVQLVMTIFPTSRDDRYNAVKKLCYCNNPVASQVINLRTIKRPDKNRPVAQKVALQMNAKLGGGLWAVTIPVDGLMIVGIDVYHDKTCSSNSWGGFVATLNQGCTRWYSKVCKQLPGQELTDGLKICLLSAIKEYHKVNHKPPNRIVIFRDGVGDGDMKTVKGYEVPQLQSAFPLFGEGYQPTMAMIVVQKRINTKLYSMMGNALNPRYENPPPGTIVDHTVTRTELVDFFLVSQFVRQGTVTPTHYVVVHNDTSWNIDKLQKLSYKMTHMYYNWPGTIRAPAPCQYAHKLAYMAGQNLKRDPSPLLATKLFYL